MDFIRGTFAVIIGYLVMTASSMAMVRSLFSEGAVEPEGSNLIMTAVALGLGAAVGGFLCTIIVGSANSPAIYIAIGLMLVTVGRAYATGAGIEPDWYRLLSVIASTIGFLVGASAAAYRMDPR